MNTNAYESGSAFDATIRVGPIRPICPIGARMSYHAH